LIYASAHPLTSLIIAKRLSSKYDVPWVAEFRDLWTDNQYYQFPAWRKWLEKKIERYTLSTISAAVTVSEPLADVLRNKVKVPVATILNGFDPTDYSKITGQIFSKDTLNIIYTGMVYVGKQDPSPLFAALKKMEHSDKVRIYFYGRYLREIEHLADQYGVRHLISVSDSVPYNQSIQIQMQSDVLLLLLWNDKSERGVYTGKLFEYFGARHPILAIGLESGVAAELIRERKVGFISNDSSQIAKQLDLWIEQKINGESDFALPESASAGLTRNEQFVELDAFLRSNSIVK
jgi:hypothetical protein